MQPAQQERPMFSYAPFYMDCAQFPHLPKFRRFGAQWAKKLYDDTEEILRREKALNNSLLEFRKSQKKGALSIIECPRSAIEGNEELRKEWREYENLLTTYSQNLLLSHKLFKLPEHARVFSERMNEISNLFHNGEFGPTGERNAGATYQNLNAPDFVAWLAVPDGDMFTDLYINSGAWVEAKILRRLRALLQCRRPPKYGTQHTFFKVSTVVHIMDFLTSIFVPLFFMAIMYALVLIHPLHVRIAIVGVLGLVFSISAKLLSARLSRSEIFAYTAAYYGVASVFVSATNNNVPTSS